MTRRIILVLVGTVAAALLLAGLGTLVLVQADARTATEKEVREEALGAARLVNELRPRNSSTPLRAQQISQAVARTLGLDAIGVVVLDGERVTQGSLPLGIVPADLDIPTLLADEVSSGIAASGDVVFGAVALRSSGDEVTVLVTTKEPSPVLGRTFGWFLLSALATLAIGAGAAVKVGRSLTRPVKNAQGATSRIAAGDLTTRLPEPKQKANDELAQLTRSINAMAESLEQSRGAERQFLMSISHDLRTPLTSIRGYAEAVQEEAAEPQWAAGVILSEARRLERLVADLLDLSRLEARRFSLDNRLIDLSVAVERATDGFVPEAADAGIELTVEIPEAVRAVGDSDRLAQVMANLLENALKFARSRVTVRVGRTPNGSVIEIADDGPGIPHADLPHVFERLYVSRHEPERKEAGSGLGLAIVRELVHAMGGTVRAESVPGAGTTMVVELGAEPPSTNQAEQSG